MYGTLSYEPIWPYVRIYLCIHISSNSLHKSLQYTYRAASVVLPHWSKPMMANQIRRIRQIIRLIDPFLYRWRSIWSVQYIILLLLPIECLLHRYRRGRFALHKGDYVVIQQSPCRTTPFVIFTPEFCLSVIPGILVYHFLNDNTHTMAGMYSQWLLHTAIPTIKVPWLLSIWTVIKITFGTLTTKTHNHN